MSDLDIKSRILLAAQSGLKFTPEGMANMMADDVFKTYQACLELHKAGLIELLEPPCWYGIKARIEEVNSDCKAHNRFMESW